MGDDDQTPPPVPGTELYELALKTVNDLLARLGIDGAIVIVIRKTDNMMVMMGAAAKSRTFNTETMFAVGVKSLVEIREKGVRQESSAVAEKGPGP